MENNILPLLNAILILNVLLCAFTGIISFWLFERYYRKSFVLAEQIEDIQHQQEIILLKASIEIREQAYKHISMELHDNISQILSLVKLNLNCITAQKNEHQDKLLEDAKMYLSKCISDISSFSKTLDSEVILSNGLMHAIAFEVYHLNKHFNDKIQLDIIGNNIELTKNEMVIIFRIIQEALNNIIKHSQATEAKIICEQKADSFHIQIKDNGKGFDVENIYDIKKSQFMSGLKNMHLRTQIIGGNLSIQSAPNKGTNIDLIISTIKNN